MTTLTLNISEATENSAQRWVETWRGQLKGHEDAAGDPRVQHLLAKHLR